MALGRVVSFFKKIRRFVLTGAKNPGACTIKFFTAVMVAIS
jgi:hypothetical protein